MLSFLPLGRPRSWAVAAILPLLLVSPAMANLTKTVTPNTAQQEKALQASFALVTQGQTFLKAGAFSAAEKSFRTALTLDGENASADPGLAEALAAQGKTAEALRVYRALIHQYPRNMSSVAQNVRTRMHYAILLSRTGQWQEAVSVYEGSIPTASYGDMPKMDVHFDPRVPMAVQLQALAHVASGIEYTGQGQTVEAFNEFNEAIHLAPDSAFANYYYGFSWRSLSPKDQAKVGSEQQARAALQKAVQTGKGEVKQAAQRALKGFNKPA